MEGEIDDLEYRITFPTQSHLSESVHDEMDLRADEATGGAMANIPEMDPIVDFPDDEEPVVYVLGAADGEGLLSEISQIYSSNGCITITYGPPTDNPYFFDERMENLDLELVQKIGVRLLELLADYDLQDHPLLFHIIGESGAIIYSGISKALCTHRPSGLVLQNAVFGSSVTTERSLFEAIVETLIQLFGNVMTFIGLGSAGTASDVSYSLAYRDLVEDKSVCPTLILCHGSTEGTQQFVEERRQLTRIAVVNMPTDGNVDKATLLDFLDQCVSIERSNVD